VPPSHPPKINLVQTGNSFSASLVYAVDPSCVPTPTSCLPTYVPVVATLLGAGSFALSASSTVTVALAAPYLNVEILLDNSGSMEIAATPSDIAILQELTACSVTGAYYCKSTTTSVSGTTTCNNWVQSSGLLSTDPYYTTSSSGQSYAAYGCTAGAYTYNGTPSCPLPATTLDGVNYRAFPVTNANPGPSCASVVPMPANWTTATYNHSGVPPAAGAPCAFACHFDTKSAAGTGKDYYALARSTIGTPYQVNLRFDLVKAAVKQVITTMQMDNLPINNLNVGIFWFADILTRVYPKTSGEAGNDWVTALADVGGPSTVANGADTGIQPYVGANGGNTDFSAIMATLQTTLSASGDGSTATTPSKVLFIVTDGLQDPASRAISAFNPSACAWFKSHGYGIYVLYTPYYSSMNPYYLNGTSPSAAAIVGASSTATNSIPYNLQQCASTPTNYIEASDSISIAAALKTFLKQALAARARITH
jgi:hypothetical protein